MKTARIVSAVLFALGTIAVTASTEAATVPVAKHNISAKLGGCC